MEDRSPRLVSQRNTGPHMCWSVDSMLVVGSTRTANVFKNCFLFGRRHIFTRRPFSGSYEVLKSFIVNHLNSDLSGCLMACPPLGEVFFAVCVDY